jgi:hypothetical protein
MTMRLSSVLELRDETLESFYEQDLQERSAVRATASSVPSTPERRLAIGARYRGKDDYQVAIRVQRDTGIAMRRARELVERLPNPEEADLAVLKKVAAPSRQALASSAKDGGAYPGAVCTRPIDIGYSVGHLNGGPGTLGLLADSDKGIVALSNNHVIALANRAERNDQIYQCGIPDGPPDDDKVIGRLGSYRKLRSVGSNYFDAAYCVLDSDLETNKNLIDPNFKARDAGERLTDCFSLDELIKAVNGVPDGEEISVAKLGRTTGYTSAPYINVSIAVNDLIVDIPGLGNCRFDNVVEVEWVSKDVPFTDGGDSGSALYLERLRNPFGLMFASGLVERGRKKIPASFACLLSPIFDAYKLDNLK